MNQSMNDEAVCRTAPATPGLSTMVTFHIYRRPGRHRGRCTDRWICRVALRQHQPQLKWKTSQTRSHPLAICQSTQKALDHSKFDLGKVHESIVEVRWTNFPVILPHILTKFKGTNFIRWNWYWGFVLYACYMVNKIHLKKNRWKGSTKHNTGVAFVFLLLDSCLHVGWMRKAFVK